MGKKILLLIIILIIIVLAFLFINNSTVKQLRNTALQQSSKTAIPTIVSHPLSIKFMRSQTYPGSDLFTEQTLPNGSNYTRSVVSYQSEGLKIYALLTVPLGTSPANGWPVIIFNHGYIPPTQYRTTERYLAYTDAFSRNGYVVLKSDYRGHGDSEGTTEYPEYSPAYTLDVLNGLASVKKLNNVDKQNIGMWGHSMGGSIVMRSLVVSKDIKAAEIWAGVVGTYADLAVNHHGGTSRPSQPTPIAGEPTRRPNGRTLLTQQYGEISKNPTFWNAIDPMSYIADITAPIQIQHGTIDAEVPYILSEKLHAALTKAGKPVTLYSYEGDDHNLANNLTQALSRSVTFFDTYLKPKK